MAVSNVSNVMTSAPRVSKKVVIAPSGFRSAGLLGIAGVALTLAGFLDLALAWYPIGIGNPEWEFGTVSGTLNSLPLLTVGLVLVLAGAHESGQVWKVRLVSVLFAALALLVIGSAILYVMDVPLALRSAPNALVKQGLVKAIIKAFGLIVVYSVVFTWIAVSSWRRTTSR
jgi:hypothetical protein